MSSRISSSFTILSSIYRTSKGFRYYSGSIPKAKDKYLNSTSTNEIYIDKYYALLYKN